MRIKRSRFEALFERPNMSELVERTKKAAELVGLPAETLAMGNIHYHTLAIADATAMDRVSHVSMLLSATSALSDIVTAPYQSGGDGGHLEPPEPDPLPVAGDGVEPEMEMAEQTMDNPTWLRKILNSVKG
jgi:hypothetical protein